jgi:hypothetical protein
MVDRGQVQVLASRARQFQERVPVYRLGRLPVEQQLARIPALAGLFWDLIGDCSPVFMPDPEMTSMARLVMPEDRRVNLYTPSGAIDAFLAPASPRHPIADDESRADRTAIRARLRELAERFAKHFLTPGEEVRPERLWETKARGVTMKRESSPVALLEVLGSLRRYVDGLPVLGRASIHVAVGAGNEVTKWGIDWRARDGDAIAEAEVIDPDEAARRILAELRVRNPELNDKRRNAEPERMTLGYLSMSRRVEQRVLQPAWVAMFPPPKGTTMGVVIAVPAAPSPYEPLGFPARL